LPTNLYRESGARFIGTGGRRVLMHSAGRTGLMLRALVMRLFHLGLDAHMVGDMTAPPIGAGDLLLVNASTGDLPSGLAHIASRTSRIRPAFW